MRQASRTVRIAAEVGLRLLRASWQWAVRSLLSGALVCGALVCGALGFAAAEEARKVWHDATEMVLSKSTDDNGIEIAFGENVPPALRELGVTAGTMLVRGQWEDDVLVGEAWAFSKDCKPISYAIRGVVAYSGALIVFGPVPTSCDVEDYGKYSWGKEAILRFDMPPPTPFEQTVKGSKRKRGEREQKRESKPAPAPKPKAKPKPTPKPRAAPRPTHQQPYQQWPGYPQQWRW